LRLYLNGRQTNQTDKRNENKIDLSENVMTLQLCPEFIKEIEETVKKGKFVKVKDFAQEYGLK